MRARRAIRSNRTLVVLALLAGLGAFPEKAAFASARGARPAVAAPAVASVRLERPPAIDGRFEEDIWSSAAVLDRFTQYEPQEGGEPSERTVAYIGHDERNLYIFVRCFDSDPKGIRACLTPRDKVMGDDEVTIYLDTFNDMKRAFVFQVNPCGVQSDGVYTEPTGRRSGGMMGFERIDRNWDTFFRAAAEVDDQGYTVELAIPFKSLRFPNLPEQTWGLQLMRSIRRKSEEVYWSPRSRNVNGFLVQAGRLRIPGPIEKGKNLEIMPVVTGAKATGERLDPQAGLNLKYGITSDLTADVTWNPDFSQIESDIPQVDVNQRYPLYYPEKRPFFLEGKDFFDTPIELLYTRTLLDPQWGAKLTGKIGRTTLGFMSVLDTNAPDFNIPDAVPPEVTGKAPRGLFNVLRVKQDLFSESSLGFFLADKEMGYEGEALTRNYNRVAGIDGLFKFGRYYRLTFQAAGSETRLGETKTGFAPAFVLGLSRQARHLQLSVDWTSIHPDFEAGAGFLRRKDIHSLSTRVGYSILPQNAYVISITPSLTYRRIYDFSGDLTDEEKEVSLMVSGWKQAFFWMNYQDAFEKWSGLGFRTRDWRFNLSMEPLSWLSARVSRSFGDGIYYSDDPYLGYKTGWQASLTLKPLANIQLSSSFINNDFRASRRGELIYRVDILSERLNVQISKPLSVRLIADYNDYYDRIFLSFLLSYQWNQGTVFYLGVDQGREKDPEGLFRSTGTYVFVKFSYWWRT